jgi:hypothetical protein
MHGQYSKQTPRKKPGGGSRLTLHYILNGKTVCQADYRLSADARYLQIPLPVARLL